MVTRDQIRQLFSEVYGHLPDPDIEERLFQRMNQLQLSHDDLKKIASAAAFSGRTPALKPKDDEAFRLFFDKYDTRNSSSN